MQSVKIAIYVLQGLAVACLCFASYQFGIAHEIKRRNGWK